MTDQHYVFVQQDPKRFKVFYDKVLSPNVSIRIGYIWYMSLPVPKKSTRKGKKLMIS